MRRLLLYYLAFIIVIIEAAMFVSLILAPLALWLRDKSYWFKYPFDTVDIVDRDMETMKKNRILAKAKRKHKEERK